MTETSDLVAEQMDGTRHALAPLADWRVTTDLNLRTAYEVNGQDLTPHVRRAAVILDPNALPVLQLELRGVGTIEGPGIVKVILDEQQAEVPLTQAVMAFLNSIDPAELEQRAVSGEGGMGGSVGQSFLAAIKQMALA